ncbi:unnamed protein product [Soboliphyme baturini]|uniref:Nicotinate phosphoribosyltransferase n=1 Tax=Soboliphyme baturini TaxID=241478 RepID=A0A183IWA4_9BILA|nr:unnamed protein product [Soboliphyme baturini]
MLVLFLYIIALDLYEIKMCYVYWKSKMHERYSVFDLFFRKTPFKGEFAVFCGLNDVLNAVERFKFSAEDIEYLKTLLPSDTDPLFWLYLSSLDCSKIKISAIAEGSVVFAREPLIIVEGPLAICQLLETLILNLINFASLVCTNAVRFRLAAGPKTKLFEFGIRRAQGPDGALTASKYIYIGGFDATSNVLASRLFGIPPVGTQAHSFVCSFDDRAIAVVLLTTADSKPVDIFAVASRFVEELVKLFPNLLLTEINKSELLAFVTFASSYPSGFLALIDTYDVLKSGAVNFCACALALDTCGFRAVGVRIDSGDLAYLSREIRAMFRNVCYKISINDINEDTINSLNEQGHEIDCFGVGTHLVTCQKQPALGCVYKLVELNGESRIKLSEDIEKITIPGRKIVYRLYGKDGYAINDLVQLAADDPPAEMMSVLCRHPFYECKRAIVKAATVQVLHKVYWENGHRTMKAPTLNEIKTHLQSSFRHVRNDHKRSLNPTPYKVSLNSSLYDFFHSLWLEKAPIGQLE